MKKITLKIPADPEFISTVRITTASLATVLDMDIESIEDLRVAVSEALNITLHESNSDMAISFYLKEDKIKIEVIKLEDKINYKDNLSQEMAKQILETLVDKVEFSENMISFCKKIGEKVNG